MLQRQQVPENEIDNEPRALPALSSPFLASTDIRHVPSAESASNTTEVQEHSLLMAGNAGSVGHTPAALYADEQESLRIAKLRRKLPRRSFLRRMDAYWQTPGPFSDEKFGAILTTLRDPAPNRWRERMLCAWLLGHAPLTPEQQVEAARELGSTLHSPPAARDKRLRANLRNTILAAAPPALGITALFDLNFFFNSGIQAQLHRFDEFRNLVFIIMGMVVVSLLAYLPIYVFLSTFLFPILSGRNRLNNNRVRMAAALTLARLRTPESVGPLARAVLDLSPGVRSAAEPALRECLPSLTSGHYGRLDADTVPALCRVLDMAKERPKKQPLMIAVLEALGRIGDGRAVVLVERITTDGFQHENILAVARQILPVLYERQKQENDPRMLLRGASEPQTGSNQLMRAANPSLDTASEQLLRPETTS